MSATAERAPSLQREWWLRTLAIFQSPWTVFAALRDDSREAAEARQEPAMAIVILAGIAGVLSTSLAGRLLDDPKFDGISIATWAFLGGGFYGLLVYWLGGVMGHALGRGIGAARSYPPARDVGGVAGAPGVVS